MSMAIENLKGDIINNAYEELRISGITVDATNTENEKALNRLETMANEFSARNICTGYAFEDEPDPNTPHNIPRKYWHGYETNLAVRLMSIFGKGFKPDPNLIKEAGASYSFMASDTADVNRVQYPARMPKGSGTSSKYNRWDKFFRPTAQAPTECATNTMYIDNINTFVEHFDSYLESGETISSYTIEADTGLTVTTSTNSSPDIDYTISAVGGSSGTAEALLQVKIVITTSQARVQTRLINFELLQSDVINN